MAPLASGHFLPSTAPDSLDYNRLGTCRGPFNTSMPWAEDGSICSPFSSKAWQSSWMGPVDSLAEDRWHPPVWQLKKISKRITPRFRQGVGKPPTHLAASGAGENRAPFPLLGSRAEEGTGCLVQGQGTKGCTSSRKKEPGG